MFQPGGYPGGLCEILTWRGIANVHMLGQAVLRRERAIRRWPPSVPGGKPVMQSSRPAFSAPAIVALLPDYKATCSHAAQPEQDCSHVAQHVAGCK